MPTIQQYTRQEIPNQTVNSSAFYNPAGERALAEATQMLAQAAKEIQVKRDKSDYVNQLTEFELQNAKRKQELSAETFDPNTDFAEVYAKDVEERAKTLQIPDSMKEQWNADLAQMRLSFGQAGLQEQVNRQAIRARTNLEKTLVNAKNIVTLDPNAYDKARSLLAGQLASMPNMSPEERGAITQKAMDDLNYTRANALIDANPQQFIADAKAGKYTNIPDLQNKIEQAENVFLKKADEARRDAIINDTLKNPAEYQKFMDGIGIGEYTLADAENFKRDNPKSPLADYMIQELTVADSKKQKRSPEERADAWNQFAERVRSFDITRSGEATNANLLELKQFQDDLAVAAKDGYISQGDFHTFSNKILSPMLRMVGHNQTGLPAQEKWNMFSRGYPDPITPALNKINDYLEKNKRPTDLVLKKAIVTRYLEAINLPQYEARPRDKQQDLEAIDKALEFAIKGAVMSEKPELLGIGGTPNSIVDDTGKTSVSNKKSDLKADGAVSVKYKIMQDAKGNRAKVYEDGRIEEMK